MQNLNSFKTELDICNYSKRLLQKISSINQNSYEKVDIGAVHKAIYYAKKYHANQQRETGEPYYSHPLEVAFMVIDHKFNTDLIVTSILHDIIEDTECTKKNIESTFGCKIASEVDDLSKIKANTGIKISVKEMVNLLSNEKKNSLLLIKYFDRLHNMQTIKVKNSSKIKQITYETLDLFLSLGEYLKINALTQHELQKLCINC